jgi:hypothetical protein
MVTPDCSAIADYTIKDFDKMYIAQKGTVPLKVKQQFRY